MNLSRKSEDWKNGKRVQAVTRLVGDELPSSTLQRDVNMSASQLSVFLKRIGEVNRRKKYGRYVFSVDLKNIPDRIEYGREWVEIERNDDEIVIKNSKGESRKIRVRK